MYHGISSLLRELQSDSSGRFQYQLCNESRLLIRVFQWQLVAPKHGRECGLHLHGRKLLAWKQKRANHCCYPEYDNLSLFHWIEATRYGGIEDWKKHAYSVCVHGGSNVGWIVLRPSAWLMLQPEGSTPLIWNPDSQSVQSTSYPQNINKSFYHHPNMSAFFQPTSFLTNSAVDLAQAVIFPTYFGGSSFESQPGHRLLWIKLSWVFSISPSNVGRVNWNSHDRVLPHSFQFSIHFSPYHSTLRNISYWHCS